MCIAQRSFSEPLSAEHTKEKTRVSYVILPQPEQYLIVRYDCRLPSSIIVCTVLSHSKFVTVIRFHESQAVGL